MKPIDNKTVLITGASKGIGLAIAKVFAAHGHNLILVARGQARLEQAARDIQKSSDSDVLTFSMDLAGENAVEELFEKVKQTGLSVDILVNNAGVGMTGYFAMGDYSTMTNMLRLNMIVLTQLTHLFLQPMLQRKHGRILNVGSLVAHFSGAPNWSAYVASKHYVRAFSRGLSRELKGTGVTATVVSPGATATDFVTTADATNMRAYQTRGGTSVEKIAEAAYSACQAGKVSIIPGMFNKLLAFLGELHPRAIAFEVFAFLSQKKD
ncbi:MAG: SDR family oxidoreductase [Candidatus Thiodiazotropha sp. (ex Codakia rugifera)]|nr:SDR family oxidoreductase [Candidatus Thiodiazotropha sp. (ex Codakia rugifera)]